MTWARLDEGFISGPDVLALSDGAFRLYIKSLCWCASKDTDGLLTYGDAALLWEPNGEYVRELIGRRLWRLEPHGYSLPGYRPCRGESDRVARLRNAFKAVRRRLRDVIYERDASACVRCGATEGLTLDHIVPLARGGTNAPTNLQTLCRPCNVRKGAR